MAAMVRFSLFESLYKLQLPPPAWLEASLERAWGWVRPRKSSMFYMLYLLVRMYYAPYSQPQAPVVEPTQSMGVPFTPYLDHPEQENLPQLVQEVQ